MKIANYLLSYNREIFFNNCFILKYIKYYHIKHYNKYDEEKYGIASIFVA